MNITEMRNLQLFLQKWGLYTGPIDGIWRPAVSEGVNSFQAWAQLPQNGTWTQETEAAAQNLTYFTSNGTQTWNVYGVGLMDQSGNPTDMWSLFNGGTQGSAAPEPTPAVPAPVPTTPGVGETGGAPPVAPINWDGVAQNLLSQFGLNTPGLVDWMSEMITVYDGDVNAVQMMLYDRPEFKARFPMIQARIDAGFSPMSPAEVMAYERDVAAMLHASGLSQFWSMDGQSFTQLFPGEIKGSTDKPLDPVSPPAPYEPDPKSVLLGEQYQPGSTSSTSSPVPTEQNTIIGSAFQQLIVDLLTAEGGGVSIAEVSDRINQGFMAVKMAPPSVQEYFYTNYGVNSEAAMAAYFLDPDRAAPELIRRAETANIGGRAMQMDIVLGLDRSRLLADMGVTGSGAMSGFMALDQMRTLFSESLGEETDLTIEGTGIDAQFGLSPGARRDLDLRRQARTAAFAGGGEALMTSSGASGFGSG
ncbi:MAG: peptidoglycan-binding protein [Desulfurellales bacterium]|nr:MAG: peptidoglycan-binding protein [Desulfurellales bacterium]